MSLVQHISNFFSFGCYVQNLFFHLRVYFVVSAHFMPFEAFLGPGSHSRNLEIPWNSGSKTLLYCFINTAVSGGFDDVSFVDAQSKSKFIRFMHYALQTPMDLFLRMRRQVVALVFAQIKVISHLSQTYDKMQYKVNEYQNLLVTMKFW